MPTQVCTTASQLRDLGISVFQRAGIMGPPNWAAGFVSPQDVLRIDIDARGTPFEMTEAFVTATLVAPADIVFASPSSDGPNRYTVAPGSRSATFFLGKIPKTTQGHTAYFGIRSLTGADIRGVRVDVDAQVSGEQVVVFPAATSCVWQSRGLPAGGTDR